MSGLNDQNLQEKVLTQAMLNTVKDLPTLLNYVTAEESAKTNVVIHETSVNAVRRFSGNLDRKTKMCGHCGQPQAGKKRVVEGIKTIRPSLFTNAIPTSWSSNLSVRLLNIFFLLCDLSIYLPLVANDQWSRASTGGQHPGPNRRGLYRK